MKFQVGIDDTDSSKGLCTTYLAYRVASRAKEGGFRVIGYPRLVRLNPNIPFKTRGNAAVSLPLETSDLNGTFRFVCSIVEELSDVENGANTGVVMVSSPREMPFFKQVYQAALSSVVNKDRIARLLKEKGLPTFKLGNGMGLVGASASLAFDETYDHTYELIAYRKRGLWGTPRSLDPISVRRMNLMTFPDTFNNYDYEKRRPMVSPHGPDPVFLGVRGSTPSTVLKAFRMLRYGEEPDGHMIYLSNQCTGAHLESELCLPLKAYSSGWVDGTVVGSKSGRGGHSYITLSESDKIDCAVYHPTGDLCRLARLLIPGDRVRVAGGVRRPSSRFGKLINVESIQVLSLADPKRTNNPVCHVCGLRAKSEGVAKGFECQGCGRRFPEGAKRISKLQRRLQLGLYLPSPRAHRHLTKPLTRYGRETAGESYPLIEGWIRASSAIQVLALARSP